MQGTKNSQGCHFNKGGDSRDGFEKEGDKESKGHPPDNPPSNLCLQVSLPSTPLEKTGESSQKRKEKSA